jgi:hypothetical protein
MRSVSTTINWERIGFALIFSLIFSTFSVAQENSPYSRYGLGDLVPTQNILNRAMGGLSIPYSDVQTVNFVNPASYSRLRVTTFDVGVEYDNRTMIATNSSNKYNSDYLIPSYLQLGLPLNKKGTWGMNLGMRPITRVNYDILSSTRLPDIDSVVYQFKGNGGSYQVYLGTGFGTKKFSIGFNVGYMFGNKDYSTRVVFFNDTVNYKKSNSSDSSNFGGIFVNAGMQYQFRIGSATIVKLGVNGSLENTLKASRSITRETFEFSSTQGTVNIDSVYRESGQSGEIIYPASYGAGIIVENEDRWAVGVEYNTGQWDNFRFYGEKDEVKTNWTIRIGGQFIPNINAKNYWSRVTYRAGAYIGPDYIEVNENLPQFAFTFGAGFPVRRNVYTNQYTTINTAFEIGSRGNKSNLIRENFFKIAVGLSLSDIWFNRRKYD